MSDPSRNAAVTFPPKVSSSNSPAKAQQRGSSVNVIEASSEQQYSMLVADFRRVQSQLQREQQHFQSALQVSRHELARAQQNNAALRQTNQILASNVEAAELRIVEMQRELDEQRRLAYELSQQLNSPQQNPAPSSPTEEHPNSPVAEFQKQLDVARTKQGRKTQDSHVETVQGKECVACGPELVPFCCQASPAMDSLGTQTHYPQTASFDRAQAARTNQVQEIMVTSALSSLPMSKHIVVRVYSGLPSHHQHIQSASESNATSTPDPTPRWCDEPFEPEVLAASPASSLTGALATEQVKKSNSPNRFRDLSRGTDDVRHPGKDDNFRQAFRGRDRRNNSAASSTFPDSRSDLIDSRGPRGPNKSNSRHSRWGSGDKET